MTGRRGFLSGAAKMASMGGAALLLPREALPELRRSSHLREAVEEVYVEESYELTPEQVMKLMARVKELERAIANPTWFQGRHGKDGKQGFNGMDGLGLQDLRCYTNSQGTCTIVDSGGHSMDLPVSSTANSVKFNPAPDLLWDGSQDCPLNHIVQVGAQFTEIPTVRQVSRLQDCVDYLMKGETDGHN